MDLFPFLLASADVATQAAGAPIAANLARESHPSNTEYRLKAQVSTKYS